MHWEMQLQHCNTFSHFRISASFCVHSSNVSAETIWLIRLEHIASPSFCNLPKPAIVVSIPSVVVLPLCLVKLMLRSLNKSNITPKQLYILVRDMNVFHKHVKKYFVFKFFFLMSTFLVNAMKSIMIYLYWLLLHGKYVGTDFETMAFSSVVN